MVDYSKHELSKFPFRDSSLDLEARVEDLLGRLTLDEKFRLMSGYAMWWTPAIKRLNIPKMGMSDGPRGISFHSSIRKCTQYPVPKTLASSWDRTWSQKFGDAIAKEVRATGKHILLAPGINIDRTPMNGRTFEYFSEDPLLIREMVVPLVKAVQDQNIGACVKHYVANNQETNRRNISAEIDERTLREIYLKSFEQIVKEADPWSIMSCYNRVNGEYGSASKILLQDCLVDEFGFKGFVMTDWGATENLKVPDEAIYAGLTLEMPKKKIYTPKKLHKALQNGKITLERVDELVGRLITVMIKTKVLDKPKMEEKINLKH
ncbi:MAG: glycoside hydrolase family 3 protein, partial [Promethearchaeota archaeon]